MDARGPGQWLSTNEKVMHVNQITGEAHARGEGIAEGMEVKTYICLVECIVELRHSSFLVLWVLISSFLIQ